MVRGLRVELARESLGLVVDTAEYMSDEAATFLRRGLTGAGFPDVDARWFEGAGHGATYRGSRARPRELKVPLMVSGPSREAVAARLSVLARIFAPSRPGDVADMPVLRWVEPSGETWFVRVARTGRADWAWSVDTNGLTWVRTELALRAGDPFITRVRPSSFKVEVTAGGRGLLPKLARLRVSSSQAMGERDVENPGDATAYPAWEVTGPGRDFEAVSALGERLRWEGVLAPGEVVTLDTMTGTVLDDTGANRYGELAPAPRFWTVEPGTSRVSVTLADAEPGSRIICRWQPRRWLMF
ncbi:hypothetical protein [Cellulosimicrobium sp. CpK407]|uniref:hypothetical protein n=1 Tax=Cellulosimicrobium sp. CpK407 TaxID=3229847 RepID=UPI003F3CE60F